MWNDPFWLLSCKKRVLIRNEKFPGFSDYPPRPNWDGYGKVVIGMGWVWENF